jgi:hypothetical protein
MPRDHNDDSQFGAWGALPVALPASLLLWVAIIATARGVVLWVTGL